MLLELLLLILAIPTGIILAKMAKEELKSGEKYFKMIIIVSILIGIWFFLTGQIYITWTSAFVVIVTFISLMKSYDKR